MAMSLPRMCFFLCAVSALNISNVRPPPHNRTFNSTLVEHIVREFNVSILPQPLATLFSNCLPNTLDTTVLSASSVSSLVGSVQDSFVITGDIPAMWLRDSMNQVYPYVRLVNASVVAGKRDHDLEDFLFGVLHRQAASITTDAYANAFAWWGPRGQTGMHAGDQTFKEFEAGAGKMNAMSDLSLFERKFELDSLLSLLKLATGLHESRVPGLTDALLRDPSFVPAVRRILETLKEMTSCSSNTYSFQRKSMEPTDTLSHGVGFPCRDTGMVRTHFRPSDDAVVYAFNIPGNAMAAVELARLAKMLWSLQLTLNSSSFHYPWVDGLPLMQQHALELEQSIRVGIQTYGVMQFKGQNVFAYEVDGFGNAIFMDDANVPSLLSLPFLGFLDVSDELYQRTRNMILSTNNPWYFKGGLGIGGIGGPHVGIGAIWPMSLMMQAWTSSNVNEVTVLLEQLMRSSTPNSLMHESFNKDTLHVYTRKWFAWANTLFGDLIIKLATDPLLHPAVNLSKPIDLVALIEHWRPEGTLII